MLKYFRVTIAILFFVGVTLFFVDFSSPVKRLVPLDWNWLENIQFVPALMAGSMLIVAAWVLITLLFGRLYCSTCCPLGVLQDVIAWCKKRLSKKHRYTFFKAPNKWRYGILFATVIAFFVGLPLLILLDPYAIFGRMATHLGQSFAILANNTISDTLRLALKAEFVWYWLPTLISLGMFVVILIFATMYGRRYCNLICPIGTTLGILSQYSMFRITLRTNCRSCKKCEFQCKGECIESKAKTVDPSRCVACFNCLGSCKFNAIGYDIVWFGKKIPENTSENVTPSTMTSTNATDVTHVPLEHTQARRFFLGAFAGSLLASLGANATSESSDELKGTSVVGYKKKQAILPPGAKSIEHFRSKCTACHLCVAKCPDKVIVPAITEHGLAGFLQPHLKFDHGFCNFNCTVCSEICPNDALMQVTEQEKHQLQLGKVTFVKENCIVTTQGTSCGACAEHCPTTAVHMVVFDPARAALKIPETTEKLCVGCGACEYACPVRPYRSIYVDGNATHQTAELAADPNAKNEEVNIEDIGFGF